MFVLFRERLPASSQDQDSAALTDGADGRAIDLGMRGGVEDNKLRKGQTSLQASAKSGSVQSATYVNTQSRRLEQRREGVVWLVGFWQFELVDFLSQVG